MLKVASARAQWAEPQTIPAFDRHLRRLTMRTRTLAVHDHDEPCAGEPAPCEADFDGGVERCTAAGTRAVSREDLVHHARQLEVASGGFGPVRSVRRLRIGHVMPTV